MPSLTQLLASHGRLLLLDAASSRVHVGLLHSGVPALWHTSAQEAGIGLFAGVDAVLKSSGLGLSDIGAFVFCEGPGSMLGTRSVAMAIRTWQTLSPRPAYRYQSLRLLAHDLHRADPGSSFALIADARRDTWHCVISNAQGVQPLRRAPSAEIAAMSEGLIMPADFRLWATPPRPATICPYDVAAMVHTHSDADLWTATDVPDAFQHEAPEYKKWSAVGHSSATAGSR